MSHVLDWLGLRDYFTISPNAGVILIASAEMVTETLCHSEVVLAHPENAVRQNAAVAINSPIRRRRFLLHPHRQNARAMVPPGKSDLNGKLLAAVPGGTVTVSVVETKA